MACWGYFKSLKKRNSIKKLLEWPDRFHIWIERKKILKYMISFYILKVYIKVTNFWKNTKTETWSRMIFFYQIFTFYI